MLLYLKLSRFYALDDSVVREIIGKKLSGRNRKDLDDVEEKTSVLLRSCRLVHARSSCCGCADQWTQGAVAVQPV